MSMGEIIVLERKPHTMKAETQTLRSSVTQMMRGCRAQQAPWHRMLGRASPHPLAERLRPGEAPGTSHGKLGGSCHRTG